MKKIDNPDELFNAEGFATNQGDLESSDEEEEGDSNKRALQRGVHSLAKKKKKSSNASTRSSRSGSGLSILNTLPSSGSYSELKETKKLQSKLKLDQTDFGEITESDFKKLHSPSGGSLMPRSDSFQAMDAQLKESALHKDDINKKEPRGIFFFFCY